MTAIITGSDSGIGKAAAIALAARGHDVAVTFNSDEDGARSTAEEVRSHGRRAELRHLDLTDSGAVRPAIDELAGALGGLDELIALLASPEASYVTGASYVVDGGLLLMAAEANRLVG